MSGGKKKRHTRSKPLPAQTVSGEEMAAILERTRAVLSPQEHAKLTGAIDTLAQVTAQLQAKDASIERLRRMLFGATTETTRNVLGEERQASTPTEPAQTTPQEKAPGQILVRHTVAVEIEGEKKPALSAVWLTLIVV